MNVELALNVSSCRTAKREAQADLEPYLVEFSEAGAFGSICSRNDTNELRNYQIRSFDFVADPSAPKAVPLQ